MIMWRDDIQKLFQNISLCILLNLELVKKKKGFHQKIDFKKALVQTKYRPLVKRHHSAENNLQVGFKAAPIQMQILVENNQLCSSSVQKLGFLSV